MRRLKRRGAVKKRSGHKSTESVLFPLSMSVAIFPITLCLSEMHKLIDEEIVMSKLTLIFGQSNVRVADDVRFDVTINLTALASWSGRFRCTDAAVTEERWSSGTVCTGDWSAVQDDSGSSRRVTADDDRIARHVVWAASGAVPTIMTFVRQALTSGRLSRPASVVGPVSVIGGHFPTTSRHVPNAGEHSRRAAL